MKKVQIPRPAFKALHNLVSIYLLGLTLFLQVHSYRHFLSQVMLVLASAHVTSLHWTAFQLQRSDSSFKLRQNYPFPMRSHLTLPSPSGSPLQRILEEWVLYIAAITLCWVGSLPSFSLSSPMPGTDHLQLLLRAATRWCTWDAGSSDWLAVDSMVPGR